MPDQQRRRTADQERRRWTDDALDHLREDVDDLEAEHRAVARLPAEVAALARSFDRFREVTLNDLKELREDQREDTSELRKDIRELREDNRRQHMRVAYGKDPVDGVTVLPPHPATLTWGGVAKVASVVAALFVPAATVIAAIVSG